MTLQEAIEIQEQYLRQPQTHLVDYFDDAIKLGIEALKRLRVIRNSWPKYTSDLLPGETEE